MLLILPAEHAKPTVCMFKAPMVTSRTVNDIVEKVLVIVARIKVFTFPVIYMSQYLPSVL